MSLYSSSYFTNKASSIKMVKYICTHVHVCFISCTFISMLTFSIYFGFTEFQYMMLKTITNCIRYYMLHFFSFSIYCMWLPGLCCFSCLLHWLAVRNDWSHSLHLNGRLVYVMWTFMWRVREPFVVKAALHISHRKSFVPMWVFMWALSTPEDTNSFSQVMHL